jgi:ATP-dependent Clp protease ATP-binding subunit ClpA
MKEARKFVYQKTGVAHLIMGLMDTEDTLINLHGDSYKNICNILADLGVEQMTLSDDIGRKIRENYKEQETRRTFFETTDAVGAVMVLAREYAEAAGKPEVRPEHMFYAAVKVLEGQTPMTPEETAVRQVLQAHKLTSAGIEQYFKK